MESDNGNPFKPGFGRRPPHIAGHKEATSTLKRSLRNILAPGNAGEGIILYGPRGNGKTTLLDELERLALKGGATVRHLSAAALEKGVRAVCRALLLEGPGPKSVLRWLWGRWMQVTNPLHSGFEPHASIEAVLRSLMKKGPLLVLVDEAHVMPAETGKHLFQAVQKCIREDRPLLLVLAGTPSIKDALGKTHASFVERSVKLPIGRLESTAAARDALAIPANRAGMPFDDDALDLLVIESQLYPFFLQMLGNAAWEAAMEAGHKSITLQDARDGVERSNGQRMEFYADRVAELSKQGILVEAKAVSRAMKDRGENPSLPLMALPRILKDAASVTGNSPEKVQRKLVHTGLVWYVSATTQWEPGIPSLCDHLACIPEEEIPPQAEG